MKCPVCKGVGALPEPRSSTRNRQQERQRMAKVLRKAGFSLRQIGRFLGYKSPRSVQLAVRDK